MTNLPSTGTAMDLNNSLLMTDNKVQPKQGLLHDASPEVSHVFDDLNQISTEVELQLASS